MVKRCQWGLCNADSRFPERYPGVKFIPFVQPAKAKPWQLPKCLRWVKACGRKNFTVNNVKPWMYICSQHFTDGEPTDRNPDPVSADSYAGQKPNRPQPKKRCEPPPAIISKRSAAETLLNLQYSTVPDQDCGPGTSTDNSHMKRKRPASSGAEPQTFKEAESRTNPNLQISDGIVTSPQRLMSTVKAPHLLKGICRINENVVCGCERSLAVKENRRINQSKEESIAPSILFHDSDKVHETESEISMSHQQKQDNLNKIVPDPDPTVLSKSWQCHHCGKHNTPTAAEISSISFKNYILSSDKSCFEYTGIPNTKVLNKVFQWIEPATHNVKNWDGRNRLVSGRDNRGRKSYKITAFECFLLTLVRVRKGFDVNHMSYLFGVSQSHVCRIFTMWINLLDQCLGQLLTWPTQEVALANIPKAFASFPKTRCIIDCTEFSTEKPFRPAAQKQTWSFYKHSNTAKVLVGIHPSGVITFLSKAFVGSISDQEIIKKSHFLDLVEPGDDIMADRGFNIRHLLLHKRATLNIPAFSRGGNLSQKAVRRSRAIASVRIHVERAIRRMKCFKILSGIIPIKVRFCLNQILTVVAVLANFDKPLCR